MAFRIPGELDIWGWTEKDQEFSYKIKEINNIKNYIKNLEFEIEYIDLKLYNINIIYNNTLEYVNYYRNDITALHKLKEIKHDFDIYSRKKILKIEEINQSMKEYYFMQINLYK